MIHTKTMEASSMISEFISISRDFSDTIMNYIHDQDKKIQRLEEQLQRANELISKNIKEKEKFLTLEDKFPSVEDVQKNVDRSVYKPAHMVFIQPETVIRFKPNKQGLSYLSSKYYNDIEPYELDKNWYVCDFKAFMGFVAMINDPIYECLYYTLIYII